MNDDLVYEGMRTPWGSAQTARILIPGMGLVSTAGHGGVKLSHERNLKVPASMRRDGGWYEEDCECDIPFLVFQEELLAEGSPCPQWLKDGLTKHQSIKTVMNYWPDAAAKWLKRPILPEESMVLRERAFKEANANNWVVTAAWGDWQEGVPKGMVGVVATLGEKRDPSVEHRYFLVPHEEYEKRGSSFVIDLARHQQVEDFTKVGAQTKRVVA